MKLGIGSFPLEILDTLVYDKVTGLFSNFESSDATLGNPGLPFISWSKGVADGTFMTPDVTLNMEKLGMLSNGRIVRFRQDGIPVDTLLGEDSTDDGDLIEVLLRTDLWTGSNVGPIDNRRKFLYNIELGVDPVRPYQDLSTGITIKWTDNDYQTFSSDYTVLLETNDFSNDRRVAATGSFRRRAFEIGYTGRNQIRFKHLTLSFRVSSYA
jgi:hypothetical protein